MKDCCNVRSSVSVSFFVFHLHVCSPVSWCGTRAAWFNKVFDMSRQEPDVEQLCISRVKFDTSRVEFQSRENQERGFELIDNLDGDWPKAKPIRNIIRITLTVLKPFRSLKNDIPDAFFKNKLI